MSRRSWLLSSAYVAVAVHLAIATNDLSAQQNRIPIVGVLTGGARPEDPAVQALKRGLSELGYSEGRTIILEFRSGEGYIDRMPRLAEELVRLKADVIVASTVAAAEAVKRLGSATPVVVVSSDPVAAGLVTNLAHPGGQITGVSSETTDLHAKRLQLLKETVPRLSRVGVLWNPDTTPWSNAVEQLKAAAAALSIELKVAAARSPDQFDSALSAINPSTVQALYIVENPLFFYQRETLAKLALKARLPAIYGTRAFSKEGGLMSYGVDYVHQAYRAAGYVDKILKGAKAGDLPIELPTKFELVINLKTAKALGVTLPQSILLQADEVIR